MIDGEGKLCYQSPAFKETFGYEPHEWEGKSVLKLVHPDDLPAVQEKLAHIAQEPGRVTEAFVRFLHRDGQWRHVSARARNLLDNPDVQGILVNTRDVTERIEAEQALHELKADLEAQTAQLEAANRELESFSYSVSHDLRSPLRAIEGFSRILVEKHSDALNEQGVNYLQRVRNNALRMGALIDDLLHFSRVSRRELQTQVVYPDQVVKQVLGDLAPSYEERAVVLDVQELPPCKADPSLLQQVYSNLLGNALKFTQGRTPARIEVGAVMEEEMVRYHVADNGAGFDMQYAGKLFGVFQRLHRQDEYEGTGVGLAIVHRIVHRHGGQIWAEAEPDNGATFYFTLPSSSTT